MALGLLRFDAAWQTQSDAVTAVLADEFKGAKILGTRRVPRPNRTGWLWVAAQKPGTRAQCYGFGIEWVDAGDRSGWGYRSGLAEGEAAEELDCPEALLGLTEEPRTKAAREWRAAVRASQAPTPRAFYVGDTVLLWGVAYTIQGWIGDKVRLRGPTGQRFVMNKQHLAGGTTQ